MAHHQPNDLGLPDRDNSRGMIRRRRVLWGVGSLLGVVVVCVAVVVVMLQRLEARTANFQPPMTALERQRLLPKDPVLDAAPKLDGLRYGEEAGSDPAHYSVKEVEVQGRDVPLGQALMLHETDLHANVQHGLQPASQN
ncbi:hypothetical protein ABDX87_23245 [Pseudomonas abietaniphila]|uniref:hypothetical protein n=1 Tax=Pseudomonas abietaniphila TaxID=89065 RepID=UPI0032173FA3